MDTKWKNGRAIAGFLAFFLGISLVLSGGGKLWANLSAQSGRQWVRDAFQSDYQNTAEFRSYISGYLERFLAMATGGPVDGYYTWREGGMSYVYGGGFDVADIPDIGYSDTPTTNGMVLSEENEYFGNDVEEKQDNLQRAKAAHAYFQEDKNVLYQVVYDGKTLYSNTEESLSTLPEGYNFKLSFDGEKVTALKNGAELDVYGDGYYQEDSAWYVPGYRNFTVDEQTAKATVVMAVAQQPALYVKGNYAQSGSEQQYNQLYWLNQNLQGMRQTVVNAVVSVAIGVVLLGLYFVLRRDKATADRAIAACTGKIWFEAKILIFMGTILFAIPQMEFMVQVIWEIRYSYAWMSASEWGWVGREFFNELFANPLVLTTLFWIAYLGVNDLRYGKKPWRNGLFGLLQARQLKLPIQKRMSRRAALAALALVVLVVEIAYFLLVIGRNFGFDPGWFFALLIIATVAVALLGGWTLLGSGQRKVWDDLSALTDQIETVRSGNLTEGMPLPEDGDLRRAAHSLNDIQSGMKAALEEQTRSERMKVELIANVSHDIKTPLTSIISYTELLNQEEGLPPHVADYARILKEKSHRLKTMVQDVFEVSKAASGQLPVRLEQLDLAKLLRQTLADMEQVIQESPVTVKTEIPEMPVLITTDGTRLYRVFQNLLQNALQYSLEGSRVYLTLTQADGVATASMKNTSKNEIVPGVNFTERFVRGDVSRTDGGSGLGLSIAQTFTEACGGKFHVAPIADLFVAVVEFTTVTGEPPL